MLFFVPLVVGFAAVWISDNSDAEIAYLTTVVAAVSFITSLILLPWQLKLLLIVVIWLGTRRQLARLTRPSGNLSEPTTQLTAKELQTTLSQSNPEAVSGVATEMEVAGKYRGATWKTTAPLETNSSIDSLADLKYRGASFMNSSVSEF